MSLKEIDRMFKIEYFHLLYYLLCTLANFRIGNIENAKLLYLAQEK